MRLVLCLLVIVLAAPAARAQPVSPELTRLEDLIVYRLSLMEGVAAWKWRNDRPIEDLAREAAVLEASARRAEALGLDPVSARGFITAQMEAAKGVQRHWFDVWQTDGFNGGNVDLATTLRPAIGRAGDAVLEQLALVRPLLDDPQMRLAMTDRLEQRAGPMGLSAEQARRIVEAAAAVNYASTGTVLDRILARGVLRVGTTGDYPPFSMADGGDYTGIDIDIDLARRLAASLGVELVFVPTTWPTLMNDFHAGRFDIGMSGITRTLVRQRTAYFSSPYLEDGKAPIVRCGDEADFDTLEEINQPATQIIVNPGGTNERFTRQVAPEADLTVFDDNTKIFGEIAAGRADVMLTDRIEVDYQAAKTPGVLCPAMDGTFTQTQKAFLLPRDDPWRLYVNMWLDQLMRDGTMDSVFARYLSASE